jgi:Fic family protein
MKPCIPDTLPIKNIEWEPLIPLIGKANRAIAYYDGILYGIAEPEVLLSPLTTQEAVISSKIEGTQATLGEVFRFEAGEIPKQESRRLDVEEIINYRNAMGLAQEELKTRPFSLNLLKRLHEVLLTGVRGRDKARGQFRTTQNWIGAPNTPIEKADFIPPEPGMIMEYLDNWERYYHINRPDPLVQLAIIHAQFEVIHPFLDGNGRIGRMIIPLFLFEKKYLSKPMFYIASYIEEHRDEYIARLRMLCSEKDAWNKWIEFFLHAVSEQARINSEKARSIIDLYEKLKVRVIELTHSQFAVPLLDNMFTTPIFSSNALFRKPLPNNPTKATTLALLNTLKQAEILKVIREGSGRRAQVLAFTELINLCEGKPVL